MSKVFTNIPLHLQLRTLGRKIGRDYYTTSKSPNDEDVEQYIDLIKVLHKRDLLKKYIPYLRLIQNKDYNYYEYLYSSRHKHVKVSPMTILLDIIAYYARNYNEVIFNNCIDTLIEILKTIKINIKISANNVPIYFALDTNKFNQIISNCNFCKNDGYELYHMNEIKIFNGKICSNGHFLLLIIGFCVNYRSWDRVIPKSDVIENSIKAIKEYADYLSDVNIIENIKTYIEYSDLYDSVKADIIELFETNNSNNNDSFIN